MVDLVILLAVGLPILTALVTIGVVRWRQTHLPWRPLPGHPGQFYFFEGPGDAAHLARAVDSAVDALAKHTAWAREDIERAVADLHVHVKATPSWMENTGDARGTFLTYGLQMDSGVRVGCNLAALCHEIAHRVGQVVAGDQSHDGWAAKGIYLAIDVYLAAVVP